MNIDQAHNIKKSFAFTKRESIIFHLNYFFHKVLLPLEIQSPRWKMTANDLYYSAGKIFKSLAKNPLPYQLSKVVTKFGAYNTRPETLDVIWASPAFERRDVNYLLELLTKLTKQNKKILFLDIGADFGSYSITVGNRFSQYPNLHIHAYEPTQGSYALMVSNIELNNLQEYITPHNFGLFDSNTEVVINRDAHDPGSSSLRDKKLLKNVKDELITVKRLDDSGIIPDDYDVIVFKIDVEGVESQVLAGAQQVLQSHSEKYFLVEDFVDSSIVSFLEKNGAQFYDKVTSYNSWWHLPSIK